MSHGVDTPTRRRAVRGSGSVFRAKNNGIEQYVAKITVTDSEGNKRVVRGYGGTQAQALERRAANVNKLLNLSAVTQFEEVDTTPTLNSYIDTWLENQGTRIKEQSKKQHKNNLEKWVTPTLGKKKINQITPQDLELLFYKTLPNLGAGHGAVTNAYKSLRACLRYAHKREVIDSNPMNHIDTPKYQSVVDETDREFIGKRARIVGYLIQSIANPEHPNHEHLPLILSMFLGLRRAETLGLTWDCFKNLEKKNQAKVIIRQQLMGPSNWHIQDSTKNGKTRTIPLPELWRLAFLEQREKARKAEQEWFKELVFIKPNGRFTTYNEYNAIWKQVLGDYMASDPKRQPQEGDYWRPHSNRKVTATFLAQSGSDIGTVMEILGHSSIEMTHYYTKITNEQKSAALGEVEKILSQKVEKSNE